ncbi:PSPA7_2676 family Cys-rich small protein [Pseudomonas cavernicola]
MTIRCMLLGCRWGMGISYMNHGERLRVQTCERCGSFRTVSE